MRINYDEDVSKLKFEISNKETEYQDKCIDLNSDLRNLRIKYDEDLAKLRAENKKKESDFLTKSIDLNADLKSIKLGASKISDEYNLLKQKVRHDNSKKLDLIKRIIYIVSENNLKNE
jgi:Txe/YoeB family toxin of Txe-Axe toxin-antitoxin module